MYELIEEIDVTPSTNILDVLGNSGYTLETAIADIIDNSITAKSKNIKVTFDFLSDNPKLLIIDDGYGMTLDKLKEAAVPAKKSQKDKRDDDDLGRYSLGLKSASKSFCGKLTIFSKAKGHNSNCITIDFDQITATKKWVAYVVNNKEYSSYVKDKGTVVIWENLKFLPNADDAEVFRNEVYDKMASVETHIAHVFSDFILNNKIKFYINGNLIEGWDPFATNFDNTKITYEFEKEYKNELIKFKTYIIPLIDSLDEKDRIRITGYGLQNQQGFYIYRNNRIISEGGWLDLKDFQYDNKANYCRIRVDIPSALDKEFQTNFIKSSISIPIDLVKEFKNVAKNARRESLHNYNYTKNPRIRQPRIKGQEIPIWFVKNTAKGISLQINTEHPLISDLSKDIGPRKFNRIISMLTKTIPVAKIQNSVGTQAELEQDYIEQLMKETYEHLKQEGKTKKEIEETMSRTEPFNKYFSILLEFLSKVGEENDK